MGKHTVSALTAITMLAVAHVSLAQAPRTPGDLTPVLEQSQGTPKSKSDAYRLVGKVVEIDRASGVVKLSTEEGERMVKPTTQLLAAIRVGDTISVPRAADDPVSASPRIAPRTR